jgi:hypothetical protein
LVDPTAQPDSAKSRLGEKVGYVHCQGDGLQFFLTDGRSKIDTNPVENTISPITHIYSALLAVHDEEGRTWERMASLIETCRLNVVTPYAYLRETSTAIANDHPKLRIDDLMLWSMQKSSRPNPEGVMHRFRKSGGHPHVTLNEAGRRCLRAIQRWRSYQVRPRVRSRQKSCGQRQLQY